MNQVISSEALGERASNLAGLNGIRLAFVELDTASPPGSAKLEVAFYNTVALADIVDDVLNNGVAPTTVFRIAGGSRIPAGEQHGEVQVTDVTVGSAPERLTLTVAPVGDYSTYTLTVVHTDDVHQAVYAFDPVFDSIDFKFRPGCFNLNCAPEQQPSTALADEPLIDYLARDYHSFKHLLINAMRARVPDWEPTSEADLDQVLIGLLAADADELCDYQDRVVNEAYLGRARKRVSLARHARLMDYHIHQGNRGSTWLALEVDTDLTLPADFGVWTGTAWNASQAVIFTTEEDASCHVALNTLQPYTWSGVVTALDAGATSADISLTGTTSNVPALESDADALIALLSAGKRLVIEQKLNPDTGTANGVDRAARQLLEVTTTQKLLDPQNSEWLVRVNWRDEDRLTQRHCLTTRCTGQPAVETVTAFHGNLVMAYHGRPHLTVFRAPGKLLAPADDNAFVRLAESAYEETQWGTLCRLPHTPLAYRNTATGGEVAPETTLTVNVDGFAEPWSENSDLIESDDQAEHFQVETDENDFSTVRFGNGVNGRALPSGAAVTCSYRVGGGSAGNVGADVLTGFDAGTYAGVSAVRNPFDVTDGSDPETVDQIIRRAPEAYRSRQLRAVTLEDYAARAEELAVVSSARARYAWTGSWRTVRVAIDPVGSNELSDEDRASIAAHLDAVRLIGEDLEVRTAHYVSLDILLTLCAHSDYWPEDLLDVLETEFSNGYTTDGRPGLFHPDEWTFGDSLYASQLVGRALSVTGIERVLSVAMRRFEAGAGPTTSTVVIGSGELLGTDTEVLEVDANEILRVDNDPNSLEDGRIRFDVKGGRQ